jgi:hypothetical protein
VLDGQPFLNDELREQRSRQRRLLREIPAWYVKKVAPPKATAPEGDAFSPGEVEAFLRGLAAGLTQDVRRVSGIGPAVELGIAVQRMTRPVGYRNHPMEQAVSSLRTIGEHLEQSYTGAIDDEQHEFVAARFVLLAAWADDLADDSYADPAVTFGRRQRDE